MRTSHVPEQLSFDAVESQEKGDDRLFFAIPLPPETAEQIARLGSHLRHQHGLRGDIVDQQRLHITLHHFDDYNGLPPGIVSMAKTAASGLKVAPFDVVFDRAVSFKNSHAFVLRGGNELTALLSFRQALSVEMIKTGLRDFAKSPFTPHVTLQYDDRLVDEHAIEPVRWTVNEFVLVHSLIGKHEHRHLARWPLS